MKNIRDIFIKTPSIAIFLASFACINVAYADLLGMVPDYPSIAYDNTGTLVFDSGTGNLDVDADPLELTFNAGDDAAFIVDPRSVTIRIQVNGACGVAGGNPGGGDDLQVIGDVLDPMTFATIKSGVLLTGTIVDMGESAATATTSLFDFRFTNVGGLLVIDGDWPAGQDAGVLLTSENSNFADDCIVNFNGGAKGSMGPVDPVPPVGVGTGTQGYWKNHLEAWPLDPITVGGVTRTAEEAQNLMLRPPKGDKTWSMYRQLTAAVLNVANGADDSCIASVIADANQWLIDNELGSGVSAGSAAWKDSGDALHETLDAYNNGELCAPHRD
jgi:hypothetical protein